MFQLHIIFLYVFGLIEILVLFLPLIALQYHEVKVNVTLGAETELMGKLKTADTDSQLCW